MRHRGPELDAAPRPRNLAHRFVGGKSLSQRACDDVEVAVPRLIVPAYFHPASHPGEWQWLAERAAQIRLVVLNLADGPGGQADPAVGPALDQLRSAGITVSGYVDTNYGQRPARAVIADLRRHLDWYQVDGVFFDRAAIASDQVSHYADLAWQARDNGARLVAFNHGAHPIEPYADHADLLGTFEGPWSAYLELAVPRWVRSRPAGQFFHLLHAVPTASFADALWLAAYRHAGCAYVTDRGGVNPWDGLPAGELAASALSSR
jgi:Spherulation-specific family 4